MLAFDRNAKAADEDNQRLLSLKQSKALLIIMKKIKNISEFDRPREKMEQKGVKALSNLEL